MSNIDGQTTNWLDHVWSERLQCFVAPQLKDVMENPPPPLVPVPLCPAGEDCGTCVGCIRQKRGAEMEHQRVVRLIRARMSHHENPHGGYQIEAWHTLNNLLVAITRPEKS